jgi:hypothetical protein
MDVAKVLRFKSDRNGWLSKHLDKSIDGDGCLISGLEKS